MQCKTNKDIKVCNNQVKIKKKILIVGDQFGKNCSQILYNLLENCEYTIEGIAKTHAGVLKLSENIFSLTRKYASQDFVVIMFNEINVKDIFTLKKFLRIILPISKFTNLLILTESGVETRYRFAITDLIKKFHHQNSNISLNYSGQLHRKNLRQSKLNACFQIKKIVTDTNKVSLNSNLVSVKIHNVMNVNTVVNNRDNPITINESVESINCNSLETEINETVNITQTNFLYPRLSQIILAT